MARALYYEIERLKTRILHLGSLVESNLRKAVKAFLENDGQLAERVKKSDTEVDNVEIDVEEECLRILALHQPVASDLRFVVTVLKINNDLERIGDLAVKIADKVVLLSKADKIRFISSIKIPEVFKGMFDQTIWMLTKSLDAFVNEDPDLAYKVILWDDEVDAAKHSIRRQLEDLQLQDPSQHIYLGMLLSVSRSVERIADHATNICEDIIYMLQGHIVRHDDELG